MELILPLVKKYGAAIIALPNDETEIPEDPQRRRRAGPQDRRRRDDQVRDPARGHRHRPARDADRRRLAARRRAPWRRSALIQERARRQHDAAARRTSRSACPTGTPSTPSFLPMAMRAGLTSAIMDARTPQIVEAVQAADLMLGNDEWGATWIRRTAPGRPPQRRRTNKRPTTSRRRPRRRRTASEQSSRTTVRPRVRLHFAPSDKDGPRPAGRHGLRRGQLERHRDRLHLRRPRHVQEVQGADAVRRRARRSGSTSGPSTPTSSTTAGGWPAWPRRTTDLEVDVPPLTTRPKAATVGVGRQVILRPAVQKRYVELDRADAVRPAHRPARACSTQIDDLELRVDPHVCATLGRTLRAADFKVTAVVVDDVLIGVEPGDTTDRALRLAFDLGHHDRRRHPARRRDRHPGRGPVDAQQAAAVRRRRHHPDQRDDARPRRPRTGCSDLAHETLDELAREVCEEAGVDPAERLRGGAGRQRHHDAARPRHRPRAAGRGPVHHGRRSELPGLLATDLGVDVHPRARAIVFPALGAYVGGDIIAGVLATGMDRDKRLRLFIDIGTNCEIVLGDGERLHRHRRPGRARRSRRRRSGAGCARPTAPSRSSRSTDDGARRCR